MSENTYLTFSQKNKYRLRVQARDKYRNLYEEEKKENKETKKENMERIDVAICLEKRSKD